MKNKKMFFKSLNVCMYSICFILLFGCMPSQKKLEKYASLKEYDKLYSYVESVNTKLLAQIIALPAGHHKTKRTYRRNKEKYNFALTTLVSTKDTTILKKVENMCYEFSNLKLRPYTLQAFNDHGLVFENLEKFCEIYNDALGLNDLSQYDTMLVHINDWRSVRFIYESSYYNKKYFLESFPIQFFKHPEVQKLKYEIELELLEQNIIEPLEMEISEYEKIKNADFYGYRDLSGYIVGELEPNLYEVLETWSDYRYVLLTKETRFTSKGNFRIEAKYVKEITMDMKNGFKRSCALWVEVTDEEKRILRTTASNLKDANNELKEAMTQKKELERKIAALNKRS